MIVIEKLNDISFHRRGIALFDENELVFKSDDYDMVQVGRELGSVEQKLYKVEIDGADGIIDLTDSLLGGAFFKNVADTYTYNLNGKFTDRERISRDIYNNIHGRHLYMIACDDITHYMRGRVTVKLNPKTGYNELVITYTREPYRLKAPIEIEVDADFYTDGGVSLSLVSGRKFVTPKFTTLKEHKVSFEGNTYIIPDNSVNLIIPGIVFSRGSNELNIVKTECRNSIPYTWADICGNRTIDDIGELYDVIDELSEVTISELCGVGWTFEQLSAKRWCNLRYLADDQIQTNENLKILYEWGEL